jgi:hypothetical protein
MKHLLLCLLFLLCALYAGFSSATSSSNIEATDPKIASITTSSTITSTTSPPPLRRILQSSAPRVIAEAYECDENQQEIAADVMFPKRMGAEIRVCIAPNTPTRNRGVFIRSIEDFKFFKNGGTASQVVIANRVETDTRLTLLLCIPGAEICSFKTTLVPDLFFGGADGNITGTGEVAMQEGRQHTIGRRQLTSPSLLRGTIQWRGGRQAQVADLSENFAGLSNVKMEFSYKKATKEEKADVLGETESWWASKPLWLRILIIVIIIATIIGCCCCGLSCAGWLRSEYVTEKKQEEKRKSVIEHRKSVMEQRKSIMEQRKSVMEQRRSAYEQKDEDEDEDEDDVYNTTNGTKMVRVSMIAEAQEDDDGETTESSGEYPVEETMTEEDDDEQEEESQPTINDVCFDADEHPGTIAYEAAVRKSLERWGDQDFGPPVYRAIKKQLPGRRFFICDDPDQSEQEWREVPKQELVETFGAHFDELKLEHNIRTMGRESCVQPLPTSPKHQPPPLIIRPQEEEEDDDDEQEEEEDESQPTINDVFFDANEHPRMIAYEAAARPQEEDDDDDEQEEEDESQPTINDVCFDADEHPGTMAYEAAVRKSLKRWGGQDFGPPVYRAIKKQLPGRRFFICDDPDQSEQEWREVPKQELVETFGAHFDELKLERNMRTMG